MLSHERFQGSFDYSNHFTIPGWQTLAEQNNLRRLPDYYLPTNDAKKLLVGIFRLARQDGSDMQDYLLEVLHVVFPTIRLAEEDRSDLREHLMNVVRTISGSSHPTVGVDDAKLSAEQGIIEVDLALGGFAISFHDADEDDLIPQYSIWRYKSGYTMSNLLFNIFNNMAKRDIEMLDSPNGSEYTTGYLAKFIFGIGEDKRYMSSGSRQLDVILERVRYFITNASYEDLLEFSSSETLPDEIEDTNTLLRNLKQLVEVYNAVHENKTQLPVNISLMLDQLGLNS